MSKGLKIMLFWSLVIPVVTTIIFIGIDYFSGKDIKLLSYSAIFLGFVAGGLIFAGPIHYLISKSKAN